MENLTHGFSGMNHVLQPVKELRIKNKTMMSQFAKEKGLHFL